MRVAVVLRTMGLPATSDSTIYNMVALKRDFESPRPRTADVLYLDHYPPVNEDTGKHTQRTYNIHISHSKYTEYVP